MLGRGHMRLNETAYDYWSDEDLREMYNDFNEEYFGGRLRMPASKVSFARLNNVKSTDSKYNARLDMNGYEMNDGSSRIRLDSKFRFVSMKVLEQLLVHEMIHVWQDEHTETNKAIAHEYNDQVKEAHGKEFMRMARKLYTDFGIKIGRYTTDETAAEASDGHLGAYYVCWNGTMVELGADEEYYEKNELKQRPGYFTNYLTKFDIAKLKKTGWTVYANSRATRRLRDMDTGKYISNVTEVFRSPKPIFDPESLINDGANKMYREYMSEVDMRYSRKL